MTYEECKKKFKIGDRIYFMVYYTPLAGTIVEFVGHFEEIRVVSGIGARFQLDNRDFPYITKSKREFVGRIRKNLRNFILDGAS